MIFQFKAEVLFSVLFLVVASLFSFANLSHPQQVSAQSCQFWCAGCGGFCGDAGVAQGKTCNTQQGERCGEKPCYITGTCETGCGREGDRRCGGNNIQVCQSNGTWRTLPETCGGNTSNPNNNTNKPKAPSGPKVVNLSNCDQRCNNPGSTCNCPADCNVKSTSHGDTCKGLNLKDSTRGLSSCGYCPEDATGCFCPGYCEYTGFVGPGTYCGGIAERGVKEVATNSSFCDNDPCANGFTCEEINGGRCVLNTQEIKSGNIIQMEGYLDLTQGLISQCDTRNTSCQTYIEEYQDQREILNERIQNEADAIITSFQEISEKDPRAALAWFNEECSNEYDPVCAAALNKIDEIDSKNSQNQAIAQATIESKTPKDTGLSKDHPEDSSVNQNDNACMHESECRELESSSSHEGNGRCIQLDYDRTCWEYVNYSSVEVEPAEEELQYCPQTLQAVAFSTSADCSFSSGEGRTLRCIVGGEVMYCAPDTPTYDTPAEACEAIVDQNICTGESRFCQWSTSYPFWSPKGIFGGGTEGCMAREDRCSNNNITRSTCEESHNANCEQNQDDRCWYPQEVNYDGVPECSDEALEAGCMYRYFVNTPFTCQHRSSIRYCPISSEAEETTGNNKELSPNKISAKPDPGEDVACLSYNQCRDIYINLDDDYIPDVPGACYLGEDGCHHYTDSTPEGNRPVDIAAAPTSIPFCGHSLSEYHSETLPSQCSDTPVDGYTVCLDVSAYPIYCPQGTETHISADFSCESANYLGETSSEFLSNDGSPYQRCSTAGSRCEWIDSNNSQGGTCVARAEGTRCRNENLTQAACELAYGETCSYTYSDLNGNAQQDTNELLCWYRGEVTYTDLSECTQADIDRGCTTRHPGQTSTGGTTCQQNSDIYYCGWQRQPREPIVYDVSHLPQCPQESEGYTCWPRSENVLGAPTEEAGYCKNGSQAYQCVEEEGNNSPNNSGGNIFTNFINWFAGN